jgi:hypothetical protein
VHYVAPFKVKEPCDQGGPIFSNIALSVLLLVASMTTFRSQSLKPGRDARIARSPIGNDIKDIENVASLCVHVFTLSVLRRL